MTGTASSDEYSAPSSEWIANAQDTTDAYRLLLAQRKLYSQSKRWLTLRWVGMLLIAIAAPVAAVIWQDFAVVAGAVAGGWIFVGQVWLYRLEQRKVEQAAAVQEVFDHKIFNMPSGTVRSALPSLEELYLLAGRDTELQKNAARKKLTKWYSIDPDQRGMVTIAICQRSNASYSDTLLKMTARIWLAAIVVWIVGLTLVAIWINLSLSDFLLGIFLPVLPAFLDVWQYWRGIRRAAQDRRDLVTTIESKLENDAEQLSAQDLLVWQAQLYNLRRGAPQVPDAIYWLTRSRNEAAMESAAQQLSSDVNKDQ